MARKPKGVQEPLPSPSSESPAAEAAPRDSRPSGIKDIARALGISIGTVDRAIHGRGGINAITKERVLKMAQTLGYRPNLAARYLKFWEMLMIAGPMTTTNSAGKMQNTIGKSIFTGAFRACSWAS